MMELQGILSGFHSFFTKRGIIAGFHSFFTNRGIIAVVFFFYVNSLIANTSLIHRPWEEDTQYKDAPHQQWLPTATDALANHTATSLPSRTSTAPLDYLNCTEIASLEILYRVGSGQQKRSYAVRLPNGEVGIAKRCHSGLCYKNNYIEKEGQLWQSLYEENGSQAVRFYGMCRGEPVTDYTMKYLKEIKRDFTIGTTVVLELGEPLMPYWAQGLNLTERDRRYRRCFAKFYTPADLADLVRIAQNYANRSKGPIILSSSESDNAFTDNDCPQQYITVQRNTSDGRSTISIKHADFDFASICSNCTYEHALDLNCNIISKLVDRTEIPKLDCSKDSPYTHPSIDPNGPRINLTYAREACLVNYTR